VTPELEAAARASDRTDDGPSREEPQLANHRGWHSWPRWWPGVICCGVYVALAMAVYGHPDALGSGHMSRAISPDTIEEVWWLAWTAFALPHGHNVLAAQWQNYPAGENFGANGSMFALGILFLPITKLFGPIAAWNIALRMALAVSACSMCLVLRRWTTWWPAAFVGGLLYGFSAYAIYLGGGYLFLTFVPLPPVVFLLLHEILVRQHWRPGRTGALLGLLCALQFFIWSEILASMVVFGVIAVALFLLVSRHDLVRRRRYAVTAFAYSVAVGGVLLALPVFYTLAGPQSVKGTPVHSGVFTRFPSDLLGAIVPSSQLLTTNGLMAMANMRLLFATGLYLGVPLLVVLVAFAVVFRSRREILFAGMMAAAAFVLSMGPHLRVDGHETPIPLPFVAFEHLPLVQGMIPVRLALYTSLFAAVMVSIGLDELRQRLRRSGTSRWRHPRWRPVAAAVLPAVIAGAVVIPLVPRHTESSINTDIPSFFTTAAVDALPQGGVVLAYPYPDRTGSTFYQPNHAIMLDQAVAGMRFKLIGGYGWFPSRAGLHGTTRPALLRPKSVEATFDSAFYGTALPRDAHVVADLRVFLRRFDVQSVIVLPDGANPGLIVSDVTAAIGCPVESDGVAVWTHVKQRLRGDQVRAVDASIDTCGAFAKEVTNIRTPANGATLSGTMTLNSTVSGYFEVTMVQFYITGGPQHHTLVVTGSRTPLGWIARWNTTSLPNGTYTLQSVGFGTDGRIGSGTAITVTVKN